MVAFADAGRVKPIFPDMETVARSRRRLSVKSVKRFKTGRPRFDHPLDGTAAWPGCLDGDANQPETASTKGLISGPVSIRCPIPWWLGSHPTVSDQPRAAGLAAGPQRSAGRSAANPRLRDEVASPAGK